MPSRRTRWVTRSRVVRLGLGFLALGQAGPGGWALFAPRSFYAGFPLAGRAWVSRFPPYNEHLVRDFGALSLALALMLALAAFSRQRGMVCASALACLVFNLPHLVFHCGHLGRFSTLDTVTQLVSLVVPVVVAAAVLLLATLGESGVPPGNSRRPALPVRHAGQADSPVVRFPGPARAADQPRPPDVPG